MAESERPVTCLECGLKNPPGTRACRECGEPLPKTGVTAKPPRPAADDDEDDRPRRRRSIEREDAERDPGAVGLLVPVGVSGWAVAAGYLGLLGCIPCFGAPFALLGIGCGIFALMRGRNAGAIGKASGATRAIVGIVCGVVGLLISAIAAIGMVLR